MTLTDKIFIRMHAADLAIDFLIYDRRDDEDLPPGLIEQAINAGVITVDEIVSSFKRALQAQLGIDRDDIGNTCRGCAHLTEDEYCRIMWAQQTIESNLEHSLIGDNKDPSSGPTTEIDDPDNFGCNKRLVKL